MPTGLSNASGLSATGSSLILGGSGLAGSAGLSSGGGLGGGPGGLRLDFGTGVLPSSMTFTRASPAWGHDSAGVLAAYTTDAPRFVYDPATLANLGLLIEGARTNSIRNSTMVGAAAGSPGTLPTNWNVGGLPAGMTFSVAGVGVVNGMEYVDIRYQGAAVTAAGGYAAIFDSASNVIASSPGSVWTESVFVALVAGSATGINAFNFDIVAYPGGNDNSAGTILPLDGTLKRASATMTINTVGHTHVQPRVAFNVAGGAMDFTLRYALPQLELGEGVSSPIKTSTVAVTRAQDIANITDPRVLTDACYVVKARTPPFTSAFSAAVLLVDDGSIANLKSLTRNSANQITLNATAASSATAFPVAGTTVTNADFAVAGRWATNDFAVSLNGAAVVADTVGASPVGLTTARIGRATSGGNSWFSTIRSIETRATASDAELVALSGVP